MHSTPLALPRFWLAPCVLAALLCTGCGGGGGTDVSIAPVTTPVLGTRLLLDFQYVPAIDAGNYVFQSQGELAAVWNSAPPSAVARLSPGQPYVVPPLPSGINFQTSTLVAVSLGLGTPCHTPQIVDISVTAGTLLVKWMAQDPTNLHCTLASLHAAEMLDLIVIPKFTGPVTFQHVAN